MNTDDKERLALHRDMEKEAASLRIRAARLAVGLSQEEVARQIGRKMTKQKIRNAEAAANYPPHDLMRYYYREHRIDFNFLMHGDYAQLPGDVQERLFPALQAAHIERDQKAGLD